jgi:hypothetical protein
VPSEPGDEAFEAVSVVSVGLDGSGARARRARVHSPQAHAA